MKSVTITYKSNSELIEFIELSHVDSSDVLVQIFSGVDDIRLLEEISSIIKEKIPQVKIIGLSTDGEIKQKKVSTKKIVISITYFQNTKLKIISSAMEENSYLMGMKMAQQICESAKLMIMFTSGFGININRLFLAFKSKHEDLAISGGIAGDNGEFKNSFVICDGKVVSNYAVGVVLMSDSLRIYHKNELSWKRIGVEFTVTRAIENVVYKIEDITPYDLYKKFLGEEIAAQLPYIGTEFPLIISDGSKCVARAVLGKNPDGSLTFAGDIPIGSKVSFSVGSLDRIYESSYNLAEDISNEDSEAIFIYSCMARRHFLKNVAQSDIEYFKDMSSVAGCFTYGEFFVNREFRDILNNSITVLGLSESEHKKKNIVISTQKHNDKKDATIIALSNMTAATSNELRLLNQNLEKRVQESILELEKRDYMLEQSARLAQMGEMVSMIAHQWRQPLSAISSTVTDVELKLILKKFNLPKEESVDDLQSFILSSMDNISYMVQTLTSTVDDFRDFYKEDKRRELSSITEPIESSLKIVRSMFQSKSIEIKKDYSSSMKLYMYTNEMMQVVMNILKNAQDNFLERDINEPKIHLKTYSDEKYVYIEITDNGGGIDELIIDRVFDPYFSTKDEKNGSGLGLYMSKIIIEDHHGGKLNLINKDEGVSAIIALHHDARGGKR